MSKYDKFNEFVVAAVKLAESEAKGKYGKSLNQLYDVKDPKVVKICITILDVDWYVFIAVAALLMMGVIAFYGALTAFLLTGVGLMIVAPLAFLGLGAYESIKILYTNKSLPLAIKQMGEKYREPYKRSKGNMRCIDMLLEEAACFLIKDTQNCRTLNAVNSIIDSIIIGR